ncbi:conserved hypothetical protein [Nitrospira sp. ND1]|nr:conserved hypothetical protein [Nitrospira sp. ND1]
MGLRYGRYQADRFDVVGAVICLVGRAVIMYMPRPPM